MVELQPDAVLVLGDTNSCLSVIGGEAAAHPDLSHGGGQPLQGRMPARGNNRRIVDIIRT